MSEASSGLRAGPDHLESEVAPGHCQKLTEYDGISISDAKGAGVLLQQMCLEHQVADLTHKNAVSFCENMPAVLWATKMTSCYSWVGDRHVQ